MSEDKNRERVLAPIHQTDGLKLCMGRFTQKKQVCKCRGNFGSMYPEINMHGNMILIEFIIYTDKVNKMGLDFFDEFNSVPARRVWVMRWIQSLKLHATSTIVKLNLYNSNIYFLCIILHDAPQIIINENTMPTCVTKHAYVCQHVQSYQIIDF